MLLLKDDRQEYFANRGQMDGAPFSDIKIGIWPYWSMN
jgi:hypothetical protein